MTPRISLAHLTVLGLPPPEMIRLARRTGFDDVSLRLIAVTPETPGYRLMDRPEELQRTREALAETGIGVNDIEFVKITPELDPALLGPFLEAGAALGARHVVTAPYDPDLARLADTLGAVAERAAGYGLRTVIEFFTWTAVKDLATAAAVAEAAGPEVGILVDTLHFHRSPSTLDELARIAPVRLPFVHVADAPAETPTALEDLLHTARAERLPPGEGGIDIAGILARMPKDIPIELEVPMNALTRAAGPEAVARRVREGLRRTVGL